MFTIYALDLDKCPVSGTFKGSDVLAAIRGHVLAQAALTGVYSLNPNVKAFSLASRHRRFRDAVEQLANEATPPKTPTGV